MLEQTPLSLMNSSIHSARPATWLHGNSRVSPLPASHQFYNINPTRMSDVAYAMLVCSFEKYLRQADHPAVFDFVAASALS
jgi:hypothetical protein